MKLRFSICALTFGLASIFVANAIAQDTTLDSSTLPNETRVSAEGVIGDYDKHHRGPVVTVGTSVDASDTHILADAYVPADEFKKYPLKFEFFVNRELVSTQVRSSELPGAVGVTVSRTKTPLPLNYSVVVTIIHPNHLYTSMVTGAVFESNLAATYDCALTISSADDTESSTTFESSSVSATQNSNSSFGISFSAPSSPEGQNVTLSTTVKVSGTTGSADLDYSVDGTAQKTAVSGDVTSESGAVTSFELSSEDGLTTLSCTK